MQLDRLQDGEPIGTKDLEILLRILARLPRFPRHMLQRWTRPSPTNWSPILTAPSEHRTEVHRLSGTLVQIERAPLPPEMASRLDFKEYYRATVQLLDSKQVVTICTRSVPAAWRGRNASGEQAGALGIFLMSGRETSAGLSPVFVAERLSWFPQRENAALGVRASDVYLAKLGFDAGLWDDVRSNDKNALTGADRESFYQLLHCVAHANRTAFIQQPSQPLDIISVLRDSTKQHGQIVVLDGIARRVLKVRVEDVDVRERFGLDHYFQIDLFVDLDKQVVKLRNEEAGDKTAIFENSFPVTVCVPSLPQDLAESDSLREYVRIHGVFFKLWSYSSEYVSSFDKSLRQISPMLIGMEPRVVRPESFDSGIGYFLAAVTALALVGIWFGMRAQRSSGKRVQPSRTSSLCDEDSDCPAPLPERPDFTNLN